MSALLPDGAVVVRADDVETLANASVGVHLLADASDTGHALSSLRVDLRDGADGAAPHRHHHSSEMFYILDGTAHLLAGDQVITAHGGDLVVVAPDLPHAFAAPPAADAELLIVITPGIERFEYFRHLARIALGELSPESLLDVQERYDTHFLDSAAWRAVRL